MSIRIGLLHTVPALVPDFHRRLTGGAADAELDIVHVADPSLLSRAIDSGVTGDVEQDVERYVRLLAEAGSRAILVTCSSIGGAVDRAAEAMAVPVLRVDRPMAIESVRVAADGGGRIAVLATLEATLAPTTALIRDEARRLGANVEVSSRVLPGAFEARARGDDDEHDGAVRSGCAESAASADVIVLAQASMAQAPEGTEFGVPVLSSPDSGSAALLAAVVRPAP